MGSLCKFDLRTFGCDIYFETGTGASLAHALEGGCFSRLYSVEIHGETAEKAAFRFKAFPQIRIINGASAVALETHLPEISAVSRILFFLDAHYPGEASGDFKGYRFVAQSKAVTFPLENELQILKSSRPTCDDVVIIDDLRIYENGPFKNGNMPADIRILTKQERNIDFVHLAFPERKVVRDYRDEGYLLIIPARTAYSLEEISRFFRARLSFRRKLKKIKR